MAASAGALWSSDDADAWADSLKRYPDVLLRYGGTDLANKDRYWREELPQALLQKNFMSQRELERLMEWKLSRGKWRPLIGYIRALSETEVEAATKKGCKLLKSGKISAALDAFITLRGVGPATASGIMAAADGTIPFMSDEAMMASMSGRKEYSAPFFKEYLGVIRGRAAALGGGWDSSAVEKALWSAAVQHKPPKGAKTGPVPKKAAPGSGEKGSWAGGGAASNKRTRPSPLHKLPSADVSESNITTGPRKRRPVQRES
jgi:hypothetical protein